MKLKRAVMVVAIEVTADHENNGSESPLKRNM